MAERNHLCSRLYTVLCPIGGARAESIFRVLFWPEQSTDVPLGRPDVPLRFPGARAPPCAACMHVAVTLGRPGDTTG
jgi:hypothetical protein